MMTIPIKPGLTVAAGKPQRLFDGEYVMPLLSRTYDISPDGRRFLMIKADKAVGSTSRPQLIVVQNWFKELKRLVPTN